jgi:hypothetical protein
MKLVKMTPAGLFLPELTGWSVLKSSMSRTPLPFLSRFGAKELEMWLDGDLLSGL